MVCGGFLCSKNALAALNVLYILVSFILIGVAAYSRVVALVTSLTLVGSIIACGVFLFIIALVGLIGAIKHHQVLLFFYMIILFLLFLLQFSLACACLAVNDEQRNSIAKEGWAVSGNNIKADVQYKFDCCGFSDPDLNNTSRYGHPSCNGLSCCLKAPQATCCTGANIPGNNSNYKEEACPCKPCADALKLEIHYAFTITGGVGLFFSFTEILGVWITIRFRNQKDPRANPSSFL